MKVIQSKRALDELIAELQAMKMPFTVDVSKGKHRSIEQNRLQWLWLREATEQLKEDTIEGNRAYCKLHFGVPILRGENADFREKYDKIIKPLPYDKKLSLMATPFDFAVTSLMKSGQLKRYLDDVYAHFTEQGARLTEPDPEVQ